MLSEEEKQILSSNLKDWEKQPKRVRKSFQDFHAVRMTRGWAFMNITRESHEKSLNEYRTKATEFLATRNG